jgi:hypothetical protein
MGLLGSDFDLDLDLDSEEMPFHFTSEDARLIHAFGERLILHDKFDVGNFAYRHRPHYWRGKKETKHMSAFHHWIPGFAMIVAGQVLGAVAELHETYKAVAPPAEKKEKKPSLYDELLNIY